MTKKVNISSINNDIATFKHEGHSVKDISDTHHTFRDLYRHRMILTRIIAENYHEYSWKSKQHNDGSMFDGDFIVGFNTPKGQYTYHYKLEFWDFFANVKTIERAPKYDGHKPNQIDRLLSLLEKGSNK